MSPLEKGIERTLEGGCPDVLAPVIRQFVTAVCELFPEQRVGVLLVGSASRGELSWQTVGDKTVLFSDIEFLIGVDQRDRALQAQVDDRARAIAKAADLGEFFHIDYTFIEWPTLPRLDTKFFTFESKARGIDLCAHELAPLLPTTDHTNLNWKELNEILVHRLSSILHAIPADFFDASLSELSNRDFALSLAKNTLDITTWLHPYEASALTAGYGNRVADWKQSGFSDSKLSGFFAPADIHYLASCIELRRAPFTTVDARQMLRKTLKLYEQAIRYCRDMNGIAEPAPISGFNASRLLFDEYRLRPRLAQTLSIVRSASAIGLSRLMRNFFGVRRGLAVEMCSDLIWAALRWPTDQATAREQLSRAQQNLSKLIRCPDDGATDFPSRWHATREALSRHQQITQNY